MNKGSKGTDSRDKVTVKISPEKGRNVEISSGVTGPSEKKSKDGVIKKNKNRQDDTAKVGDQRKKENGSDEGEKKSSSPTDIEVGVVEGRKALSESLFKLSAFMSQLQKKSIDLESGRKYAVELRKQLKETEDLVKVREGNVEKLRESIKLQHQQIVTERSALVQLEEACKAKGVPVPEEGAENIQKKLAQIKNTAMKVKTTQSTEVREEVKDEATKNDASKNGKTLSEPKGSPPEAIKTAAKAASVLTREELSKPKISAEAKQFKVLGDEASLSAGVGLVAEQVGSSKDSLGGDFASPLAHLRSTAAATNIDPNRTLCRFQLSGKCLDPACPDQHTAD